ncbi:MAG: 50S ribosomal protein L5, partial [Planctomycetota bacterium]
MSTKPRLQVAYEDTIRSQLVEKFGYKNTHQIPRLEKVTLNMGVGQAIGDKKILDLAIDALTQIAGQ